MACSSRLAHCIFDIAEGVAARQAKSGSAVMKTISDLGGIVNGLAAASDVAALLAPARLPEELSDALADLHALPQGLGQSLSALLADELPPRAVRRIVQAQRSTFLCGTCQRR